MSDFVQIFQERVAEIEAYLQLLDGLEEKVSLGFPQLELQKDSLTITVQHQKILYSSVYLQLYNLVESTISRCFEAVTKAIDEQGTWLLDDLSDNLRKEWVRIKVQTSDNALSVDKRLELTMGLCEYLMQSNPIRGFSVDNKGKGGNWDDESIYDFTQNRLGFVLNISDETNKLIKRPFKDDDGALVFIKKLRNSLAHGNQSFEECGTGVTVRELRELKECTITYLSEVVDSFKQAIDAQEFLQPSRRPTANR